VFYSVRFTRSILSSVMLRDRCYQCVVIKLIIVFCVLRYRCELTKASCSNPNIGMQADINYCKLPWDALQLAFISWNVLHNKLQSLPLISEMCLVRGILFRLPLITENEHLSRDPQLSCVTRNCQICCMQLGTLKTGFFFKLKEFLNVIIVRMTYLLNNLCSIVFPNFRCK